MAAELRAVGRRFQLRALRGPGLRGERDHRRPRLPPRPGRGGARWRRPIWRACARPAWPAVAKHFPGHGAVRRRLACGAARGPARVRGLGARYAALSPADREQAGRASWRRTWCFRRSIVCRPACRGAGSAGCCAASLGFHGCVFADDLPWRAPPRSGGVIERVRAGACRRMRRPAHLQRPTSRAVACSIGFGPDVGAPASQARLVRMRARGEAAGGSCAADPRWQRGGRDGRRPVGRTSAGADRGAGMMAFDAGLYRRLLESSPEGVVLVDAQARGSSGDLRQSRLRGLDRIFRGRAAGQEICACCKATTANRTGGTGCARRSSAGESCRVLLRNYRKDGSLFWNEMTVLPLQGCGRAGHAFRGPSSRRRRAAAHRSEALARLVERRASTDRRRASRSRRRRDGWEARERSERGRAAALHENVTARVVVRRRRATRARRNQRAPRKPRVFADRAR